MEDLPDDVKISRVKNRTNTSRSAISIALYGDEYKVLKDSARTLRDQLESYNAVSQVRFVGMRDDEIIVQIDPVKLNYYELTVGEVARAIKQRNINLSAGQIQTKSTDLIVRTISEFMEILI